MDIVGAITSIEAIDLLMFFALFGMGILGFMQGIIRRLLGIASILISLLIAAQIRGPLGDFLAANWTQYPPEYNRMIAFGTIFLGGSIASTIAIQLFFRPIPLFAEYPWIDEVIGGVLGVIQGALIIGAFFIVTDPFFLTPGPGTGANEFPFVRQIHEAFQGSLTASIARDRIVPFIFLFFGALFPPTVRDVFAP
ncbi:MAG TPA: CvpA family protein [Candidatus Sulfomarinibacteraceae bacterium]|nr:CvpA family protein [Candidatus Sulfomarinibacteraceae bacterium]